MEIRNATPSQNSYVDIPLKDLAPIVAEVLRRDLMNAEETDLILDAALGAMHRQERRFGVEMN